MNEEMPRRRSNNTNPNYTRWIIGVAAIVIVLLLGWLIIGHVHAQQNAQAEEFNKTHFNQNVKIYDVSVGKLTVNKAYQKVNKKGKDRVTLEGNKIIFSKSADEIITKKQVEKYFKQQYTKMPSSKSVSYLPKDTHLAEKKLKELIGRVVTYKVAGKSYDLKQAEMFGRITYENGKYIYEDNTGLKNKIKSIAKKVNTLHTSYTIKLATGKKLKVTNGNYGWAINNDRLIPAIEQAFSKGIKQVDGKDYIYGEGFTDGGLGYGMSNHGLGNSYVIVSLKAQKLWVVKGGKVVVTVNDVVTGTLEKSSGSSDATPTGVYYIGYKQSPSVLRGTNDDGSKYASKVSYWMPFTLDGCGIHDASWRTDWSKTAYLRGGSHGCVNVRPSEIKSIWNNVHTYEPVIVY
ncbi:lipoprotein-anchoring transpeptidase ErfK/SrfK [Lactobacillus colini]|uniref:Lipoprotein-anchoring transpeptidase ErfK/SrfK n=1 Tax=Lactobacillus colini TaxID=1819254 RepID=A0ABS4MEK4_9LACO|nr:L,D-transpeptidase family protein [Lactobacillus colini]MBP2058120.1 lipoprotein-anchoring transpeptidase ErfK/SrfK [Lactobacillus colini]